MFTWYPHPIYTTDGSTNFFLELLERLSDFGAKFAVGAQLITNYFFTPMGELMADYPLLRLTIPPILQLLGISNLNLLELMFLTGFTTYIVFTVCKYIANLVT